MNRKLATIAATIGLIALTSCSAQQRHMYDNITRDEPAVEVVVDQGLTVTETDVAFGSDPPVTECTLPGEVFTATPWPQCIPDPCVPGERWVEEHCIVD